MMKIALAFLLLSLSWVAFAQATELLPFTSDYCSSFAEGTHESPALWEHCCVAHDLEYWIGGTSKQRKAADKRLKTCVQNTGEPLTAFIMYIGVRLGGSARYQASFSWGYGWSESRGNSPLTQKEKQSVRREIKFIQNVEVTPEMIEFLISEYQL